ncbi:ATP-binding protein [Paenibacillus sp. UMB7766-LJ446]|uniref:ATP-binding protein n=1 Tax=Paenibacillus sp. UMB7766-LJ446 TaxID=3046313 RepID=UPI00254E2B77|nr:ATP-binding protein [Paenibacillus sp. UMB7766-LJ446]MDK8193242.1 ATP-binding protein [Paenibacillus sp. UMB7766-LJ446]
MSTLGRVQKKTNKINVEFPIAYFEGNLIFNHNKEVWAIYELNSYIYDHLSDQQKLDRLLTQTASLNMLTDRFHILWLPKTHDIHEHHENLRNKRVSGPLKSRALGIIDMMEDYLIGNYNAVDGANNADYKAYLVVYLPSSDSKDLAEELGTLAIELKKFVLNPKRAIENFAGLNDPEIFEHEYLSYQSKERQIFERLSRRLKIKRGTEATTEWLIRRNFWWGIAEPPMRSTEKDPWSPKKTKGMKQGKRSFLYDSRQVLTLTEADIDTSHPRRITMTQLHEGIDKSIHHAYLSLSDLPENMDMPGSEWLYSAATLPFPVSMSIKVDILEARDALKKLSRKRMDIDNQVKNIHEARATVPVDLQEKQENAMYLEDEYKKRKNPTFITQVTYGLYHTDLELLKSNVSILTDHYRDFGNIQVELPSGDQWLLFNDFIPGSPKYVTDYIHRIPPEFLAAGMVGATQELGDGKGLYIGTTGSLEHPVYLDPANASQENRSPSMTVTGTLGGGKSVTANLLGYQNAILGGKTLIFDPKGERSNWPDDLPELAGQIQVATLSTEKEDMGKLDPFVMLDDIETAKEAAVEILAYLSSTKTNSVEYSYISQAVNIVAKEPDPYLAKTISVLYGMGATKPQAMILAEILESFETLSFAKLLFGTGGESTIKMDYSINIIQIQNLKLPSPEKAQENYSLAEKMSVALMFAIARFTHKFIYHDTSIFKFVLMDEAWALLGTEAGKALADTIVRTGRSLNGGAVFITQNATDVAGDLAGNIGVKFAFRDQDSDKIKNTLAYFGLEATQQNIDMIRNLENGQCLMQDLYGRIGLVHIDVVFQHLFDCFDTRPHAKEEEQAQEENANVLQRFQNYYDEEYGEEEAVIEEEQKVKA